MDDLMLKMMQWGQQGYNCSQILLLLGLDVKGESNPQLVRAAAGLAFGCGSGRAACGALTGACCLLAFLADSGDDSGRPAEQLPAGLQTLSDWFEKSIGQRHGGTTCEMITGEAGPAAFRSACGVIVADTYAKVVQIATDSGWM